MSTISYLCQNLWFLKLATADAAFWSRLDATAFQQEVEKEAEFPVGSVAASSSTEAQCT